MFGLPPSTEFNKRIPKQKFYENINVTPAVKRIFVEQIKTVYWRNKIAASTTTLAPGETVNEIEVFEVKLTDPALNEAVLQQMDKEIPYHIIFLMEYDGNYQAWTAYKEANTTGHSAFKVAVYYHTDWLKEEDLPLHIDGLNLDTVYENFVRQIAGKELTPAPAAEESLKDSVQRAEKRKELEKQINTLQAKVRKEKQLNHQMAYNAELKKLRKALTEL